MVLTLVLVLLIISAATGSLALDMHHRRQLKLEGLRTVSWFASTGIMGLFAILVFILLVAVAVPAGNEISPEPVLHLEPTSLHVARAGPAPVR